MQVRSAALSFPNEFHINDLQRLCPSVSIDLIRKVLRDMASDGEAICLGRGKNAKWTTSVIGNA